MKMNVLLLKQIAIFSALIGLIVGVIALIPVIGNFVFTFFYIALSAGVIIYLKKTNILGKISVKEGAVVGAVIGTASFIAFSCVFLPLATLIHLLFNGNWIGQIIAACFTNVSTFMVLIFLLIFVVLLDTLMNACAGAATIYVYEVLSGLQENEKNNDKFTL